MFIQNINWKEGCNILSYSNIFFQVGVTHTLI